MKNGLVNTLNRQDASDALLDLGETLLDSQFDDGLLKDIPILGTLVKLKDFGLSISDYMLVKKLQKFAFALNQVPENERDNFFIKLESDNTYKSKVNDNLVLLINASDDIDKPEMLGKVFAKYVIGCLDYEQFMQFSTSVNGLNANQFKLLKLQKKAHTCKEVGHTLASYGLVNIVIPTMYGSSVPDYYLNGSGAEFLKVLFGKEIALE